ncbi:phytochelatin synthetase [Schizosaccharomyces pombe]|uniref:Glutathione gamma-glutamylcysteinyltransferase n=1 Tax=Schizosaccharomyces pombe (strain 972 / ATCC 24843) TaxID=284812 RepID=PCS_SCHPO|nr:phytochelatin synthetase [Schizosaccharomyces pombe]Q10075.1 RecName: Full=Glutathione gamma-glutamylcysteinyltransferase; AltName: Full=Phytochelatin synthase [Schizosaccharomyces pombe 972h-]AEH99772.1 phytochelatin synthetase [synthetic construct]CAA92263.1 phytochelatin synthetase [Schizosaccharomyces pombe]|eukprot:NP_593552.1 phytochelatin synthetase [Schizosaccharomyces pombe]
MNIVKRAVPELLRGMTNATPNIGLIKNKVVSFEAVGQLKKSFYKRQLPKQCLAFDSSLGKDVFLRALQEGRMENYFSLAQQMVTQNEPAFCGLGTLCMILNSLKVDPGRLWKGSWRWYDQYMLDCCRSLSDIEKDGVTLEEFSCLANCNGLRTITKCVKDVSFDEFRKDVISCSTIENKIMAISFCRKVLGQTGDGHFSPVGGFSESDNKILILDVARFKYPCYWVDLKLMYESMFPIDKASGQPRGYVLLEPMHIPLGVLTVGLNKYSWRNVSKHILQQAATVKNADNLAEILLSINQSSIPLIQERSNSSKSGDFEHFKECIRSTKTYHLFLKHTNTNVEYITMAFWAIFSLPMIQKALPKGVLEEIQSLLKEVEISEINTQLTALKKQLDSLTHCCKTDTGCCSSSCCKNT